MMEATFSILILTATSLGLIHTLLGPDHYIPFVAMSKAKGWSMKKTLTLTLACGLGHVGGSILLASFGIGIGVSLESLAIIDGFRGSLAAWGFIAFGLILFIWGIKKSHKHSHFHVHEGIEGHSHTHTHNQEHGHLHGSSKKLTPWILFLVFVFGPCEPLVPVLMLPALNHGYLEAGLILGVFTLSTLACMSLMVVFLIKGISIKKFNYLERYSTSMAGLVLLFCGVSMEFLGL